MSIYRRVLIPIDLAPVRQPMAPAIRRIIDNKDVEITLLHVVESRPWVGRTGHTLRLMNELEILSQRRFRGAGVVRRIEWGRPADCILNAILTSGADVVLLAAGGLLPGEPLGAVASEVLSEATCPVLLEWPAAAPVNRARVHPVCCAVEWDGNEARLVREAARMADLCAAPLILLCASPPRAGDPTRMRAHVEALRDAFAPAAEIQVDAGPAAVIIGRALRFHGAGLLVAGGSREVVLAAERECPVFYSGRVQPEVSRNVAMAAARTA